MEIQMFNDQACVRGSFSTRSSKEAESTHIYIMIWLLLLNTKLFIICPQSWELKFRTALRIKLANL